MHVVAAALVDGAGRVLIQRRSDDAHQGGLWEFPGGKLEPGEARRDGLARELAEELGICPVEAEPLIAVPHDYGDRRVLLDVWRVPRWRGEPRAREGQPFAWAAPGDLAAYAFPAADRPVLRALQLPALCLVTPVPAGDAQAWLDHVAGAAAAGAGLVQVRVPGLAPARLARLAAAATARCAAAAPAARVLVNGDAATARAAGAHGVHLDSRRLWQARGRPLPPPALVGVSCHDAADLERAAGIDADFALLGPVGSTATHPGAVPLGWGGFERLTARARLPVYALGGLGPGDAAEARRRGGQGIAAIRGLWPGRAVSAPAA